MTAIDEYIFHGVDLRQIKNKNEIRVVRLFPRALAKYADYDPDPFDVEDIYALTLNRLPPRYVQKVSIVLRETVSDEQILLAIDESIRVVRENPNH